MSAVDLTMGQMVELEALSAMSDEDIDTSDIPEVKEFSNPRRGVYSGSPNRRAVPKPGAVQRKPLDYESTDRTRRSE